MWHWLRDAVLVALVGTVAFSQVSTEKEIALGQKLAGEIDFKQRMITDAEVTGFMDRVLRTLSRDEALRFPLKLKLVDSSERIVSALPGGYLLLSSGAIHGADSEAELAGLLSHAIGHVLSGPSVTQTGSTGIPLVFVGGPWGSCLRSGAFALPAGRTDVFEIQADLFGLGYLVKAGYDPGALVTVFGRWKVKFGPNEEVGARALALARVAGNTVLNTSAFDQMKARLVPRPGSPGRPPTLNK